MMDRTDTLEALQKLARTDSEEGYQYHLNKLRKESALELIALFLMEQGDFGNIPRSKYKTRAIKELIVHIEKTENELAYDLTLEIARKHNTLCTKRRWWEKPGKPLGRAFYKLDLGEKINVLHEAVCFDRDWFDITAKDDKLLDRSSNIWLLFDLLKYDPHLRKTKSCIIDTLEIMFGNLRNKAHSNNEATKGSRGQEEIPCTYRTREEWRSFFTVICNQLIIEKAISEKHT